MPRASRKTPPEEAGAEEEAVITPVAQRAEEMERGRERQWWSVMEGKEERGRERREESREKWRELGAAAPMGEECLRGLKVRF